MRFAKLVLGLTLACAAMPAWAQEEASASDCFLSAFIRSDADAVAACYADDATLWIPGAPRAKGREAIRAMLAGWFEGHTVKSFTTNQLGIRTIGDERVSWGEWTMVVVAKETGAETASRGRYTDVSVKVDGKWLYLVDHASDDPPPPAAQ